jgi:hypothetical protein
MSDDVEHLAEQIAQEIQALIIGKTLVSFEMYQKAVARIYKCRPDQVKRVWQDVSDDRNVIRCGIFLDRPIEKITMTGVIA